MIFIFWFLRFKPTFSLSSFTFIKRLFSSSSLSTIRMVSPVYLRLLLFPLAILIPASASSSLAFCMIYSAYKLNKQGDNIQTWHTPFAIGNQSFVPCPVLTLASWPAYRFLRRQVRWSGIPNSKNFPQFVVIHTVKGFGVVNEAEIDVFLNFLAFSMIQWMLAIWPLVPLPFLNLAWTSRSSWFTYCWSLAWRNLSITLLVCEMFQWCGSLNTLWLCFSLGPELNWPFPVLWPLLSFPILLAHWTQHFNSTIFQVLNHSTGIPSLPLAFFIMMLPKANLTLHSRMSGSRWVITPLWLSGLLRYLGHYLGLSTSPTCISMAPSSSLFPPSPNLSLSISVYTWLTY